MSITAGNSLENHWLPFTANRDFKADPRLMVKAEGVYYWNHKGGRLIDGSAGLFCSAAGHGRKEIAEAVYKSMLELDYTPPFQLAHPASFELARKVAALMPGDLDYVFFCNSGSESIDTAIKIALAYHRSRGEGQRQRFVSRERAYHGVNIGGVSLSGMVRNRETFGAVMPGVAHMRHTWLPENRYTMGQPETVRNSPTICSALSTSMAPALSQPASSSQSRARPACWCRPRAISSGCARSATSTAFGMT